VGKNPRCQKYVNSLEHEAAPRKASTFRYAPYMPTAETSCVYCGAVATTDDHIPPNTLFKGAGGKRITVRSCAACNQGASLDDEYFRDMMALRADLDDEPPIQDLRAAMLRGLARPKFRGRITTIMAGLRSVQIRTPAGLHLGSGPAVTIEAARIERVTQRIVRGLFFHHRRSMLPVAYETRTTEVRWDDRECVAMIERHFAHRKGFELGDGVFTYWWLEASGDRDTTEWLFCFYRRVWFMGFTLPLAGPPPAG